MLSTAVAVWVVGSLAVVALAIVAVAEVEQVKISKKWDREEREDEE